MGTGAVFTSFDINVLEKRFQIGFGDSGTDNYLKIQELDTD